MKHLRTGLLAASIAFVWAGAAIHAELPVDIRTPPDQPAPGLHGAKVYGVRPGHPVLYRIACTGTRPMQFSATGLPSTLHLNAETGIVTGAAPATPGEYIVTIEARNRLGTAQRTPRIVIGETLGLTPQMGWNDWYTHYEHISDRDVRDAADATVRSGMADHGYGFISIDDAWGRRTGSTDPELGGPPRDPAGNIRSNARFPDMKALTTYIHTRGLMAGIYSSPGTADMCKV